MTSAFLYFDCKKPSRNFRINYSVNQKCFIEILEQIKRLDNLIQLSYVQGKLTQERKFLNFFLIFKSFLFSFFVLPLLFLFFFSFLFNFLFNYLFFRLVSSFFSSFSCLFSSSFFLLLFFFLLFLLFAFFFFRFVSNTAKISQSLIFSYLAIKDKKLLLLLLQENSLRVFLEFYHRCLFIIVDCTFSCH